ncbi:glycosyltransferase family 2 protein [Melanomma pulvis-pyrius CBS 109.77]|uniref:chitin synthase n=1 Tax=Melanomma pulvis-pyrius CBS 109.77 TaxID=1314802 RepID=A0A6A6XCC1_9PLEO|nr:glycosyltransferase family 2 protein [Melanomma pulvis-pyrius CBS 109.77]
MKVRKFAFQFTIFGSNGFLLFGSWWFKGYHYVFLPFIAFGVAVNFTVVITLLLWRAFQVVRPEKKLPIPETPETLMLIIPCYNENEEELRKSLDSLVEQKGIERNQQAVFIICDGRARGPGMTETTGECLLNTILTEKTSREQINNAYMAWDKEPMDIILQKGIYRGLPYMCIVKMTNKGKRDGLILLRSFAYKFNLRNEKPETILSNRLFGEMTSFVLDDCGINNFHSIVGMDADTAFDPWCIYHLLSELRYPNCFGVCGVVWVDFKDGPWNMWRLMQNAAYTISQGLPRLHQSIVTHKVSCLPGCCQILKVCEENNGDHTLRTLFGYCPKPTDGMLKHLRGAYSEDRNHVCHVLTSQSHVQTRQAIRAVAWTDVPTSLSVFMSQRKRWSMGATVNDLRLVAARGTHWFERIRAFSNVQTWFCNIFIMGSIAGLIHAAQTVPWYVTVGFLGGVIVPYIYMLTLVFWMPKDRKAKAQYLAGLVIYFFTGPFLTIFVLFYTTWYLDSFSWGKTRQVISEETDTSSDDAASEKSTLNDQEATVGMRRQVS